MRKFLEEHSLSVALALGFFFTLAFSIVSHILAHDAGWNFSGDVANNILSEWLALFIMVEFTKIFREKGSPESKDESQNEQMSAHEPREERDHQVQAGDQ